MSRRSPGSPWRQGDALDRFAQAGVGAAVVATCGRRIDVTDEARCEEDVLFVLEGAGDQEPAKVVRPQGFGQFCFAPAVAGWRANLALARIVDDLRTEVAAVDDLTVALDPSATAPDVARCLDAAASDPVDLSPWVTTEALNGLKFAGCLPVELARMVVARRLADPASVAVTLAEPVAGFRRAAR